MKVVIRNATAPALLPPHRRHNIKIRITKTGVNAVSQFKIVRGILVIQLPQLIILHDNAL